MLSLSLLSLLATPPSPCNNFHDCESCLNPVTPDCGWCSPHKAVFANGTKAFQCMDHRSLGWTCFHFYMHDGCVAGYTCNQTSGQCLLAPPGQGDTKENCEATCSAHPLPKHYSCNTATLKCEESPTGAASNTSCAEYCTNSTPGSMLGLWRGLSVQQNFSLGTWVMNVSEHSISWGPHSEPAKFVATVATLSSTLVRLTFSAPTSQAGQILFASYSTPGWPTGPQTHSMSIALQKPTTHTLPPHDVASAMGDPGFDVYVFHACNSWSSLCDFTPAFTRTLAKPKPLEIEALPAKAPYGKGGTSRRSDTAFLFGTDPCTVHSDCGSCIHDQHRTCGWCDGVISFHDGTTCGADGNGCCGGDTGFSHCNVAYRRTCPVTCDWTNYTDPVCRPCTSKEMNDSHVQKFENCDVVASWHACEVIWGHYCNTTAKQCATVKSREECERTPGCDPNNPQCGSNCTNPHPPSPPMFHYCEPDVGCQGPINRTECDSNPHCNVTNPQCLTEQCQATTYYTCEATQGYQCRLHTGKPPAGTPYFNTSTDCTAACYDSDITGIWRGMRIDSGFVVDEYDFEFASGSNVTYKSKSLAKVYNGTYTIGSALTPADDPNFPSFTITITLATGEVWTGLFSDKDDGPITKFMYLGLPLASGDHTTSYKDAMASAKQEFVLVACLEAVRGCDFSSAAP